MFFIDKKILTFATVAGLISIITVPANAQKTESPYADQQQHRVKTNVSDEQLQEFVLAHSAVQDIFDQYQGQVETVEKESDLIDLQRQVNEEMVQAIGQSDLSLAEYNQIASAIQFDPDVRNRYIEMSQ